LVGKQHGGVEVVEIGGRFHGGQGGTWRGKQAQRKRLALGDDGGGGIALAVAKQRLGFTIHGRQLRRDGTVPDFGCRIGGRLRHGRGSGRAGGEEEGEGGEEAGRGRPARTRGSAPPPLAQDKRERHQKFGP